MDSFPFGGFSSFMFLIVPIIIAVVFVIVIGTFIVRAIQGAKQWRENNQSPVLSVAAVVITKRSDVHHHSGTSNGISNNSSSTTYYITFEVESGDRIEFKVGGKDYGIFVEQDSGILTFQGTRFLDFERKSI